MVPATQYLRAAIKQLDSDHKAQKCPAYCTAVNAALRDVDEAADLCQRILLSSIPEGPYAVVGMAFKYGLLNGIVASQMEMAERKAEAAEGAKLIESARHDIAMNELELGMQTLHSVYGDATLVRTVYAAFQRLCQEGG